MGRMQAEGYAEAVREGSISLHQALLAHLTSNHYPPLPEVYVEFAEHALWLAERGWHNDRVILHPAPDPLPKKAVQHASGVHYITAADAIALMHLEPFLEDQE